MSVTVKTGVSYLFTMYLYDVAGAELSDSVFAEVAEIRDWRMVF